MRAVASAPGQGEPRAPAVHWSDRPPCLHPRHAPSERTSFLRRRTVRCARTCTGSASSSASSYASRAARRYSISSRRRAGSRSRIARAIKRPTATSRCCCRRWRRARRATSSARSRLTFRWSTWRRRCTASAAAARICATRARRSRSGSSTFSSGSRRKASTATRSSAHWRRSESSPCSWRTRPR